MTSDSYRNAPEGYETIRRIYDYLVANAGMLKSKPEIMRACGLNPYEKGISDNVSFHWAILRINDGIRSRGWFVREYGLSYYLDEVGQ